MNSPRLNFSLCKYHENLSVVPKKKKKTPLNKCKSNHHQTGKMNFLKKKKNFLNEKLEKVRHDGMAGL